jgi:hypothetical protein
MSLTKLQEVAYFSTDSVSLQQEPGQSLTESLVAILPLSLRYLRICMAEKYDDTNNQPKDYQMALAAMAKMRPGVLPVMEKIVIWDWMLSPERAVSLWRREGCMGARGSCFLTDCH